MRRHSGGTAPTAAGTGAGGLPRVCSTASFALLRGFAAAPGPVHCGVPVAGIGAGGPPSSDRGCSSQASCGGGDGVGVGAGAGARARPPSVGGGPGLLGGGGGAGGAGGAGAGAGASGWSSGSLETSSAAHAHNTRTQLSPTSLPHTNTTRHPPPLRIPLK